jgi:cytochrome P450
MTKRPADWDPRDPKSVPDRQAQLNEVRARCPVPWSSRHGGEWSLLRYDDLIAAAMDAETFSNAGASRYAKPLPPLEFDPPAHTAYRRLLAGFFTPPRVRLLEEKVRQAAIDLLAPLIEAGGGDLAKGYSYPLPVFGLCALLGVPSEGWPDIKAWSENTLLRDSDDPAEQAIADAGHERILAYAAEMIADRRARPRDPAQDITAALLAARIDGEPMDDDLIARTLRIFISAGHNSTTSGLGNSLLRLAENQEAQSLLRAEPERIPAAVEEFLRLEAPVQEMPRWARRDVEIRGRLIKAGERIAMFWGAGNRDEAAFPEAAECVLDRKPNRHLTFGQGPHTCLGAPMARMEIRVGLEELLARTSRFELAGEVERANFHRMGVVRLPAKLTPA